jgi:hypothetical protein
MTALDAFVHGNAILPVPVLKALAKELLGGDYDPASDRVLLTSAAHVNLLGPKAENFH